MDQQKGESPWGSRKGTRRKGENRDLSPASVFSGRMQSLSAVTFLPILEFRCFFPR
jgi:hypothetical protein